MKFFQVLPAVAKFVGRVVEKAARLVGRPSIKKAGPFETGLFASNTQ
jgi:hypothetical protein